MTWRPAARSAAAAASEHRPDVGVDGADGELAAAEAGQVEQVLDQPGQADGLGVDAEQGAAALGRVVDGAVEQRLGVALDGGERGLELVADAGQERPLLALGPLQAGGHVVEGRRHLGDLAVAVDMDLVDKSPSPTRRAAMTRRPSGAVSRPASSQAASAATATARAVARP